MKGSHKSQAMKGMASIADTMLNIGMNQLFRPLAAAETAS